MEIAYVFGACVVIGTIILIYNLIALKHERREAGLE
jgi:energy-converting hydrogenase Eha subunit C